MTYHLKEIDLTRHVRTPEGAAYYHLPIGSPIGGGGHRAVPKVASDGMVKLATVRSIGSAPSAAKHGLKAAPTQSTKAARAAVARQGTKEGKAAAEDFLKQNNFDKNLWQMDAKKLVDAIADPRTPADRKRSLKVEQARRLAAAKDILTDVEQAQEEVAKGADPAVAYAKVTKRMGLRHPLKAVAKGAERAGKRVDTEAKKTNFVQLFFQKFVEAFMLHMTSAGLAAIFTTIGIHFIGG